MLSKEDHINYEDANSKKHTHSNKSVLDGISSTNISNWNAAKTHADSAHAPSSAQANVIETVKVNGTALTTSSKAVNITVPVTTDTYSSTGTAPVSVKAVSSAIGTLDVSAVSIGTTETIKSISETDGKIAVTKQSIAIKSNQVNGMTSYSKATSSSAIATSDSLNTAVGKLEYKVDTNESNILSLNTGVYLYNKPETGVKFLEGYVMRIGNQMHINCKLTFTKSFPQWSSIFYLPFKIKIPDTGNIDGTRYTIRNTQSDGRETSIYIDTGNTRFFTSTTFLTGDIIEIKGLILDMHIS